MSLSIDICIYPKNHVKYFPIQIQRGDDMNVNTILNYVDLRGDLLTTQFPYNEIDALIFSELAYVNLDPRSLNPYINLLYGWLYQKYVQRNQSLSDQGTSKNSDSQS